MWNRVIGPKGFDTDALLPYRERLVVCYIKDGKAGVRDAYVHYGLWHWWDTKTEIEDNCELLAWTFFPHEFLRGRKVSTG